MKKMVFGWLLASATVFGAETNVVKVFTTNYVAAASNLREVDGQLYDTTKSIKWEIIRCKFKKSFGDCAVFVPIKRVKTGEYEAHGTANAGVPGTEHQTTYIRGIWQDVEGDPIVVRNCPGELLQLDKEYSPRLFLVGSTNEFQLYDFGKPHLIPVVTVKTVKAP